jgi:cell division septum initiation protein DivIVA
MQASEKNLRDMMREIEEQKERIRSLEEEVQHYKSDHTNIQEFMICAEEVRK